MKPTYSSHCDCGIASSLADLVTCPTDAEAVWAFSEIRREALAAEARNDTNRRYWRVHGPGGHVVDIRRT